MSARRPRVRKEKRQALLDRAHWSCQRCHWQAGYHNLEVHHVTPRSHGGTNDWRNLEVLCIPCHMAVHGLKGGAS